MKDMTLVIDDVEYVNHKGKLGFFFFFLDIGIFLLGLGHVPLTGQTHKPKTKRSPPTAAPCLQLAGSITFIAYACFACGGVPEPSMHLANGHSPTSSSCDAVLRRRCRAPASFLKTRASPTKPHSVTLLIFTGAKSTMEADVKMFESETWTDVRLNRQPAVTQKRRSLVASMENVDGREMWNGVA
ncbi:hypothetical protein PIB30_011541 [Stylosanthes scabra]|uniref:Uncharacterized protein n=1 Tax=Stylosanthes scabra TaxID=79078 RepID=A0ABU6T5P2_9FABA|nr:hypothetical protein [Stylosanthes scabra]